VTGIAHQLFHHITQPKMPVETFEARLQAAAGVPPPAPAPRVEPPAKLDELEPLSKVRAALRQVEADFNLGEAALKKVLDAAKHGKELKPAELLGLQAQMQRYDMEFQLLFKMVELLIGAIKELIKIQV
jgi:hypothetical protein